MTSKAKSFLNSFLIFFNKLLIVCVAIFFSSTVSLAWTCEGNTRCVNYSACRLDGNFQSCTYGSGSAVSGGVKFSNGEIFLIEWAFTDVNGNVVNLVGDNFALVNGVKTKFIRKLDACIIFDATSENPTFAYGECSK
tara:strand:+ start:138 stop:548 length:411 start_codon:yes stop_codon:yes gene_type:complete